MWAPTSGYVRGWRLRAETTIVTSGESADTGELAVTVRNAVPSERCTVSGFSRRLFPYHPNTAMPLIKCADCGKEFSDSAAACPNCGRPHKAVPAKKSIGCAGIGCLAIVVLIVTSGIIGIMSENNSVSELSSPSSAPVVGGPIVSAPKLELQSWTWHIESEFAIAEGMVKNISNEPLSNIEAVISFRTKDGTFITSDDALIDYNPILPGQTSPFKVIATGNPAMKTAGIDFKTLLGGTVAWKERAKKK